MKTNPSPTNDCPREHDAGTCKPVDSKSLISLRTLALLTTSFLIGGIVFIGTLSATDSNIWGAVLAGVATAALALERFNKWTEA